QSGEGANAARGLPGPRSPCMLLHAFEDERGDKLVGVVLGDEDAVEQLFLAVKTGFTGADVLVGQLYRLLGEYGHRLQHGVSQFARLDRIDGIRRAVEAADGDIVQIASFLERGDGAQ